MTTPPQDPKPLNHPLGCFDANEWALEFNKNLVSHGEQPYDHDLIRAWFANAIMTGYDYHAQRQTTPPEVTALVEAAKNALTLYDAAKTPQELWDAWVDKAALKLRFAVAPFLEAHKERT